MDWSNIKSDIIMAIVVLFVFALPKIIEAVNGKRDQEREPPQPQQQPGGAEYKELVKEVVHTNGQVAVASEKQAMANEKLATAIDNLTEYMKIQSVLSNEKMDQIITLTKENGAAIKQHHEKMLEMQRGA